MASGEFILLLVTTALFLMGVSILAMIGPRSVGCRKVQAAVFSLRRRLRLKKFMHHFLGRETLNVKITHDIMECILMLRQSLQPVPYLQTAA